MDKLVEIKENPQRDTWMTGDLDNFMDQTFKGVTDKN